MPAYIAPARRAFLLAAIALVAACSSDESTAPTSKPPVDQPPVEQPTDTVTPVRTVDRILLDGGTDVVHTYMGWLTAQPVDAAGQPVSATVTWSSSDANVLTIDAGGAMRGVNPGKARITVQAGGKSAEVEVTVVPRRVVRFEGPTTPITLERAEAGYFGTDARDQYGQWIREPQIIYTSADPSIVEVNQYGHLRAIRAGEARVTATADGVSYSRIVRVAAETTYPIRYANGNLLPWVVMENSVEEGDATITTRLVMTAASFTLSNVSNTWSQRTVVDEYRIEYFQGNSTTTKVATHVSTSGGAFTVDATSGRLYLTVNGDPAARLEAWYDGADARKLRVYGHPANGENAFLNDYWR